MNKADITIVQFILEGYDGLVTVSTIDPRTAILQVLIMPESVEEVNGVLEHLTERFKIREMTKDTQQALLC